MHVHEQWHFFSRGWVFRVRLSVVQRATAGHDRDTGAPDRDALIPPQPKSDNSADSLQVALEHLRLEGAVFLRAEYRESWAYESMPGPETAQFLHPGSDRVILFHLVAGGRCWVSVGGEKHWAEPGDVIVLPYGHQHHMGGVEAAEPVSIASFMKAPPWDEMPVLRYGQDGSQTDVVCGYLHSRDPLFDPTLQAFPAVFVVRPTGPAADWVRANIAYALETTSQGGPTFSAVSTRLPELLLIEVLKLHLATAPAATHGWIAALRDPVLRPALAVIHSRPERKWTVADLADEALVSRSLLDDRFRQVLHRSPIRYLTEWRMHVAKELLATTDLGVGVVARRVGYDAEEAFSRAFKRAHGSSPALWRLQSANQR
jgi:AraC-like DNA-binding protein